MTQTRQSSEGREWAKSTKRWLLVVGAVIWLSTSGCVCCCHHVCKVARDAGPDCAIPLCDRQQVYVFMINGLTPTGSSGLEGLRDKLAEQGFTKVYCGQLYHTIWMGYEMRRLHKQEPQARFVLVGYDLGGASAARLATDAHENGLPVDAVVLLDPMGKPKSTACVVRTLLVCSGSATSPLPHTETISVPDAGHFTLPAHSQTVEAICNVLGDVASQVEHPTVIDTSPIWRYKYAPPVRTRSPALNDGDWIFLHDQPGTQNVPLMPLEIEVPIVTESLLPTLKAPLSPQLQRGSNTTEKSGSGRP